MEKFFNYLKNGLVECGKWVFCPTKPNISCMKSVLTCLFCRVNQAVFTLIEPFPELVVIFSSEFVPRNDYITLFSLLKRNHFDRFFCIYESIENKRIESRKCLITNKSVSFCGTKTELRGTKTEFLGTFTDYLRDIFGFLWDKNGVIGCL